MDHIVGSFLRVALPAISYHRLDQLLLEKVQVIFLDVLYSLVNDPFNMIQHDDLAILGDYLGKACCQEAGASPNVDALFALEEVIFQLLQGSRMHGRG